MLRKLALSLAVAGALSATQANALGLGEIRVNSALNEPLNAEIKLLQVRDLSPLQIQPRMADIDEFSLAGISKSRFLSDVSFDVRVMPDGTGVIRMKSSAPIKEPFLNFLVEVNWPAGRLVREYTLLLDPPVFDPTPVPGVSKVQQAESMAAPMPQPAPTQPKNLTSTPARPENVSNIKTRMNPNDEVYVDVHDTLWELALKHRPDSRVTPEQMMLALVRKNPESFPTGNINVMKAGTVMRLPTLDEINSLTPAQAKAEAARQTQVWRQGRSAPKAAADTMKAGGSDEAGKPAESAKPERAAKPADTAPDEPASQLKVVAPEGGSVESGALQSANSEDISDSEGEGGEAQAETAPQEPLPEQTQVLMQRNEELENRLLMTQESIAIIERENSELNDKVDSIASQLDKLQRLIELKDRELAMMQQQLNDKEAAAPSGDGSIVDKVMQSPAYLGGIGAAIVAVLLGLLLALRRKKEETPQPAEHVSPPEKTVDADAIPELTTAAVASAAVADAVSKPEEEPETPVEQPQEKMAAADDIDDLDLDLDMDMELDLDEEASVGAESIDDEEFDLGIDEFEEAPREVEEAPQEDEALDSALDDILAGSAQSEPEEEVDSGLDDLLAEMGDADDLDDDLDDELPGALDEPDRMEVPVVEAEADDDSIDELDFSIDDLEQSEEEDEDVLDLPDDLEFDLAKAQAEVEVPAEEALAEDDELSGLDFSVDDALTKPEQDGDEENFLDNFFAEDPADKKEGLASIPETSDADLEPLTDAAVDIEMDDSAVNLGTVDVTPEDESYETDDELEEMLQSAAGDEEVEEAPAAPGQEFDDLDAMLASFEPEEEEPVERKPTQNELVEEELTANIAHDLETDLDAELDSLLSSTDDEIALEEESAEELGDEPDLLDSMNLLDGADEIETKLDLARAYIEMDDSDGAKDILNEILGEGNPEQRLEAERLLETLN